MNIHWLGYTAGDQLFHLWVMSVVPSVTAYFLRKLFFKKHSKPIVQVFREVLHKHTYHMYVFRSICIYVHIQNCSGASEHQYTLWDCMCFSNRQCHTWGSAFRDWTCAQDSKVWVRSTTQHQVLCESMGHTCNRTQVMQDQYLWEKMLLQASSSRVEHGRGKTSSNTELKAYLNWKRKQI